MASDLKFVEYIVDQLNGINDISVSKMFGEHALYSGDRVFALICGNQLYVKPTVAGREFIGEPVEAPPYQGAKPSFLIGEKLEDSEWLRNLITLTLKDLPVSKIKKPKPKAK